MAETSPFLTPGPASSANSLAILHLRRDQQIPIILEPDGKDAGAITNTRFGSYPHSTLLDAPWGSQILASNVNTGRGAGKKSKKRSLDEAEVGDDPESKKWSASTGFCHILPPTPEAWTVSLPHRTQVVYTPDYSFILQKMRARPGSVLIEVGAGSGSFTHAAARAVFNGYPDSSADTKEQDFGRVYSFEYHAQRAQQLRQEIVAHGLGSLVTVTHRDVYANGFLLDNQSPRATHIFLDLPDPGQALAHLSRTPHELSPLDPSRAVYLTLFLPCIEQVTKAIAEMRRRGWLDIQMFHLAHRRIDVRRDHVGLDLQGQRGVNASAATVEESIARLREVEERQLEFHEDRAKSSKNGYESKQDRRTRLDKQAKSRKMFLEGTLSHRTEPDLKTHTSYLVFGVLPREWTQLDEERCRQKYPVDFGTAG